MRLAWPRIVVGTQLRLTQYVFLRSKGHISLLCCCCVFCCLKPRCCAITLRTECALLAKILAVLYGYTTSIQLNTTAATRWVVVPKRGVVQKHLSNQSTYARNLTKGFVLSCFGGKEEPALVSCTRISVLHSCKNSFLTW